MNLVTTLRYSLPVIFIIGSVIYGIMILSLPFATLGEPELPRYFPGFVCAGIFIFALIDLINIRKENAHHWEDCFYEKSSSIIKFD